MNHARIIARFGRIHPPCAAQPDRARAHLPTGLEKFIRRVRPATGKPLSVGFGISSTEQVQAVASIADGVVVGSAFTNAINEVRAAMKPVD